MLFWGSTNPRALPQAGAECCTFGAKQICSCFGSQDSGIAPHGIFVAKTSHTFLLLMGVMGLSGTRAYCPKVLYTELDKTAKFATGRFFYR